MKNLLRIEEFALMALGTLLFHQLDYAWWWYFALFFVPDVSILGYLAGPRVGAFAYNLAHHKAMAVTAYLVGYAVGQPWLQLIGAVFLAHSSADRVVGYGMKHTDSFNHTHLGTIGAS